MRFGSLAAALTLSLSTVHAVDPQVPLNYSTYEGTPYSNGVSEWLGIRFAAPPTGNLRFAAPQDPPVVGGVQAANKHGPLCIATAASPAVTTTNEDCLFLDVYAPTNASTGSKLPVYFYIQGGGFNTNSNGNFNGRGLIAASGYNIIVVTFNYRVGPYGFLAGSEVAAGGSLNNGLKDQLKALQWVQKYISHFGGDPGHVTVGGSSAGAASVSLLLTAYGGRDDGLFHATAAESQSFAAMLTNQESQFIYDNLVMRTGCASAEDTLACLRSLDIADLQAQNIMTPFPGAQNKPLYLYSPTIDGDLVPDYTLRLFEEGKFIRVPTIWGDDTNGGTMFAPSTTSTLGESNSWLHDQFPPLTLAQLRQLNLLYPVEDTPAFNGSGRYWRQLSDVYGDLRYLCPGLSIASIYWRAGLPTWNYLWNVEDPTQMAQGYGVPHTVEVNAIFGPENVGSNSPPSSYYPGGVNAAIVPVVQRYWTSFVMARDPNMYRGTGTPLWGTWQPVAEDLDGSRLVFQTNMTRMVQVDQLTRRRCEYTASIGVQIRQ
ncbi:Alpha/Beta hydrolase protein [Phyllosticta capitalensis]|uniref:Carboxylic ester hydrolase n=1 Tax=Phyllosticta capitalensis TaxID=121624 RepID=A0ABR1YAM0_9PEZI